MLKVIIQTHSFESAKCADPILLMQVQCSTYRVDSKEKPSGTVHLIRPQK